MPENVINTWDNVQNTSCWVHDSGSWEADGVVERSAADIVALASAASDYASSAQAAANDAAAVAGGVSGYVDAASGYADAASGYAAAANGIDATCSAYMASAGGYATSASGYADDAAGEAGSASAWAASAGGYVTSASGYADTASGYAASAGGYVTSASGYAGNASAYASSAGGYATSASGYADAASGYAASAGATLSNCVTLGGAQTISGAKTFTDSAVFSSAVTAGGTITVSGNPAIQMPHDSGIMRINGGSTASAGAQVVLCGVDQSTNPGQFRLWTGSGTSGRYVLVGRMTDGVLDWNGAGGLAVSVGDIILSSGAVVKNGNVARNDITSGGINIFNGSGASDGGGIWAAGKNATSKGYVRMQGYYDSTYSYRYIEVKPADKRVATNCDIYPTSNNNFTLGGTNNRFKEIWQTNGSITGSDERLKEQIDAIPDAVLDAWEDVDWRQFKMRDSVAVKGEAARLHTGVIAQQIGSAFAGHGEDAAAYGFFCRDEWGTQKEERDEFGTVTQEAREAGDIYSIRYEEALCIEAAYQRRRAERMERRIAELEAALARIIAPLGDDMEDAE